MDTYGRNDTIIGREGLVRSFFSGTGKSYDRVVRMFTLGLDDRWKDEIVRLVPDSRRILDLGCGTGILTERLAMTHPRAEIVGVDITPDYLAEYEERLRRKPWIHARPMLGNAETVSLEGEFDAVVSSYLIKYVDADLLLNNTTPHLRRGGAFIATISPCRRIRSISTHGVRTPGRSIESVRCCSPSSEQCSMMV